MKSVVLGSLILVAAALPASAATVYSNDFNSGLNGFVGGSVETSPAPVSENLLSHFGSGGTTLSLSGLAANSAYTVNFTLDVIGSMDGDANGAGGGPGDFFRVELTGPSLPAFSATFANYGGGNTQSYPSASSNPATGAATTNSLGYSGFPSTGIQDSTYLLTLSGTADSLGNAVLAFFDLSNEDQNNNERYGIDNVLVTGTLAAQTPIPATLPLLMSGLGLLGAAARRKRKNASAA